MTINWDDIQTIDDLETLAEDYQLEAKKAQGRDGQGAFPKEALNTYSAFANVAGGIILLGVDELSDHRLVPVGLQDIAKVRKELWDAINNRQRVSTCVLREDDVQVLVINSVQILAIHVPQATRKQRPVHLGSTPFGNSYRRNFEGDYRCDDETVRRMLAEQVEDERDARIVRGYGFKDLDAASFQSYRTLFAHLKPEHPYSSLDNQAFLQRIGGWRCDHESGVEGMTVAALLMFGQEHTIRDVLPHYYLDYQERPAAQTDNRWIDRITLDGTWAGNLFEFYRRVYGKLVVDLKVPFALHEDQRTDETPAHVALREALVNTLIHADYTGRLSVLVMKRPDLFEFRNPGTMRLPLERAVHGGESDCRNRRLQKMFSLIGRGEQAGSGIPKILQGWKSLQWRSPMYEEGIDPEHTRLVLRMASLLPTELVLRLEESLGEQFRCLDEVSKLALCTADLEGTLTHARLLTMTAIHPRDLSVILSNLGREGLLDNDGVGRAKIYFLPGCRPVASSDTFDALLSKSESTPYTSSLHKDGSSLHKDGSSLHKDGSSLHKERTIVFREGSREDLLAHGDMLADRCCGSKRSCRSDMEVAIILLCVEEYRSASWLAERLNRGQESISIHYLRGMVKRALLGYRHPANPTDSEQAYKALPQGGIEAWQHLELEKGGRA